MARWSSLSLSLYMLVLVTYYSNMSTSSSTTYLSATIPTTSITSPTSLLLTLSSAQPPATSSNCTFYSLKMLLMTILARVHLGDLVGHHGHLQLLLWDVLDPLAYVWSLSMLKQLKKSWVGIFISMYCIFSQWPIFYQKRCWISGCLEGVCGCLDDVWMVPEWSGTLPRG